MKKFYVKYFDIEYIRPECEFKGELVTTSPHLRDLLNLLPLGKEIQYKSLTFKRTETTVLVWGIFPCKRCGASRCWFRKNTLNCPYFTQCPITRIIQSFFTYLKKNFCSDVAEPSSSPSSGGEDEAKDEATSRSLEPSEEGSSQITPDNSQEGSGSNLGEGSLREENTHQTTSQDQQKDLGGSSGSFGKHSSLQEDTSIQDEPRANSGSSEVISSTDDGSGEAEGGSGESETPSAADLAYDGESEEKTTPKVECQPEAFGRLEAGGSPASAASQEDDLLQGEQEKERASEVSSSLDSYPAGALSGQGEFCIKAGQNSPTSMGSDSLWEIDFNPEENQHSYGGGGGQAKALSAKDSDSNIEKYVALLLQQLFSSIEDIFKKEEGIDFWDAKKVICSSTYAPQNFPISKFARPSFRKISLWVDVSGSVSYLSEFIVSMIVSASKDKDVQVVIGSEAHPEKILPDNFHKLNQSWWTIGGIWEHNYVHEFETQVEIFLRENRLERNSLIVIWSDYMDINVEDLSKLARLLKPYKVVWLCSHDQEEDRNYKGNESFKLEKFARKQGHLFLWEINSPKGIKRAIKYLSVRRR